MARKIRSAFLFVLLTIVFLATLYHHALRDAGSISAIDGVVVRPDFQPHAYLPTANQIIHEDVTPQNNTNPKTTSSPLLSDSTVSILLPEWEVLVLVSPEVAEPDLATSEYEYTCLFDNNVTSPANFTGILPSDQTRATFKCILPNRARQKLPYRQPVLIRSSEVSTPPARLTPSPEILRWNFLVYDSLSTEEDVVLFAKGINKRQGFNRDPTELRCVFGDDLANGVRTNVTSSLQEVFRCQRPNLTDVIPSGGKGGGEELVKVTLELVGDGKLVPTVAHYRPWRKVASDEARSRVCAATMVFNVAKFLKEWVMYYSRIGVEKFILYDNNSGDNLQEVIEELVKEGYDVKTVSWIWPKTQEAGFSHAAVYAKDHCEWMMFMDVDEFVYSPSWSNSSEPLKSMIPSLLPKSKTSVSSSSTEGRPPVGQISIECLEFGPSGQKSHPAEGVTQGYNCRSRAENRHKSIVRLDAVDHSLLNAIHHFRLKNGYRAKKMRINDAVVNHYKYQAWTEFKAKFKRRVSAYVVDWREKTNLNSQDRTPGLGYVAEEPKNWLQAFCQVHDNRLKDLTRRWFGVESPSGNHMPWQR
ncbi:hypothetical protein RJ640_020714 [Escallonia rubra]|uniref:Glycosyltransferase family 92 protein n=1 Tax=Escallonia rubra TaxID=112253 RepID=A0AA88UU42_9ASTE|nr:hypothetical protein RJ640_020714 [Escallonia rubra]